MKFLQDSQVNVYVIHVIEAVDHELELLLMSELTATSRKLCNSLCGALCVPVHVDLKLDLLLICDLINIKIRQPNTVWKIGNYFGSDRLSLGRTFLYGVTCITKCLPYCSHFACNF